MAYTPNQSKYKKQHYVPFKKIASKGNSIVYGDVAIKSKEAGVINWRSLESIRRAIAKHIKKSGRIWFRVRTHYPRTKKGEKVKMGKGTGKVDRFVGVVQPGTIICEAAGLPITDLTSLLTRFSQKIGLRCSIVNRFEFK